MLHSIKFRFAVLNLLFLSIFIGCNQPQEGKNEKMATFKVWGNCEMCKKTIESSLLQGVDVNSRTWDTETKIMKVSYDSTKIDLSEIHEKISESGYDTELKKGDNEAYQNLPDCCQYTRKE